MMVDESNIVVDVSDHQGACDFRLMQTSLLGQTLVGAVVKLSQGATIIDRSAMANIEAMATAELRYRMVYHFTTNDHPTDQFDRIRTALDIYLDGIVKQRCLWIDVENNSATQEALNLDIARDLLIMCYQRWPGRVGWYAPRGIAKTCQGMHSIFTNTPLWLAAPDGSIDAQADEYNACMVQFSQWPMLGTTKSTTVDVNYITQYPTLDALCDIALPPTKKEPTMILFQMPNDIYLWNGSAFVGLGGLSSVYDVLRASGVPLVDATTTEGRTFYERMVPTGAPPVANPLQGTLHFPAVDVPVTYS